MEKENEPPLSIREKLELIAVYVTYLVMCIVINVPASFFTPYVKSRGGSESVAGFIFSSTAISFIVFPPFTSKWIMYFGKNAIALLGLILLTGSSILFSLTCYVSTNAVFSALCVILRLFVGIGYNLFLCVAYTMWLSSRRKYQGIFMGLASVVYGLGVSIGPLLGGIIYEFLGYQLVFIIPGLMLLVCLIFFALTMRSQKDRNETTVNSSSFGMFSLTYMYAPFFSTLFVTFNIAFVDLSLADAMYESFGLHASATGAMFVGYQVTYGISAFIVGKITDRLEYLGFFINICIGIQAMAFLLLGPAPFLGIKRSIWLSEMALVIFAVGNVGTFVPIYKYLSSIAAQYNQAETQEFKTNLVSFVLTAQGIGSFLGSFLCGYLIDWVGYSWSSSIVAAITFASIIPNVVDQQYRKRKFGGYVSLP